MGDATRNTLVATSDSGKPFSTATLQSMTAIAQAVASSVPSTDNLKLVRQLHEEIGRPTTKVHLPAPMVVMRSGHSRNAFIIFDAETSQRIYLAPVHRTHNCTVQVHSANEQSRKTNY